jgi:2,3-bisphosphoglycerate-independent phosphoglycerate mutase
MNYRGVLVIKSKEKISAKVSNTHPGYALRPIQAAGKDIPVSAALRNPVMVPRKVEPLERTKAATLSADIINEFVRKSSQVMKNHPVNIKRREQGKHEANIILTRDAGDRIPKLYNFSKVYGTKWACFAEMPVERGISQLSGMEIIPMPEPGPDPRKNYMVWAQTLFRNLQFYDAMYIHLKGPDIFAHIGDYEGKIKSIEDIDRYFFGTILKRIDIQNTIIVITCDHTTSCDLKAHTEHPVPLTVIGPDIVPDNVSGFWESSCAQGSIKNINAINLMPRLIRMMKR